MSGRPILVVDDAPVNRTLIRLLLTHEGYEVRTAAAAEEALQMLSDYRPELILADIQLPGMDGLDMTRKLKEDPRTSAIRVVALTACDLQEDRERAMRAGCDDYISKPIDTTTLAAKVSELMARACVQLRPEMPDSGVALKFSGSEIESLRRRFLSEGVRRSRQLLDSLNSVFDAPHAGRQLHEWAGSASLLGHPEISSLSRCAEELLRENPVKTARLREVLTDLFFTFTDLFDLKAAPLPEYVIRASSGKSVALIGFTMERADELCDLLERVQARPRLFEADDATSSEAIQDCDLVIVHVRPETRESAWLQPCSSFQARAKLVFTGDQGELIALAPDIRSRAVDFLVDLAEPEEVLMRIAFAISRGSAGSEGNAVSAVAAGAVAAAAVPAGARAEPRTAVAHPSVLLADDDPIVLMLVKTTLQNYGMQCQSATNGLDALQLIRSGRPHVAVLDVSMPGINGFEVLAAIRAEGLPTRVILLTSLHQEKEILHAFKLGADDYLTKPFNPFELVARLKRLLR